MVSGERRPTLPCLVVCPPGLEDVVTAELDDLGIRARRTGKGSISADLTTRQLYAANLFLRSATRVLVRVARFTVRSFADLERWIREVDWDPWIGPEDRPRVRVTTRHSKLWHDGAVAERFTSVLGPGSEEGREQLVVVRAVDDRFTVSVDSSGAPLHERGWRQATARAPLRESVAAALLTAARWDPTTPLVDPLCGSGTIAIEAALRATGSAPAGQRDLAFQSWPGFEPGTWASVTAEADRRVSEAGAVPSIVAADRDAGAIGGPAGMHDRHVTRGDDLGRVHALALDEVLDRWVDRAQRVHDLVSPVHHAAFGHDLQRRLDDFLLQT